MTGQTVYSEMPVTSVITVTNRKYGKEKKAMANYEIVKKIAVLGGKPYGVTKEINIVKWGVYDPMLGLGMNVEATVREKDYRLFRQLKQLRAAIPQLEKDEIICCIDAILKELR